MRCLCARAEPSATPERLRVGDGASGLVNGPKVPTDEARPLEGPALIVLLRGRPYRLAKWGVADISAEVQAEDAVILRGAMAGPHPFRLVGLVGLLAPEHAHNVLHDGKRADLRKTDSSPTEPGSTSLPMRSNTGPAINQRCWSVSAGPPPLTSMCS